MYKRKTERQIRKEKKVRKAALELAVLFMTLVTGIYTYTEIIAFAAPEKPYKKLKEQEISGSEVLEENTVLVSENQNKEEHSKEQGMEEKSKEEQSKKDKESPLIVIDAGHGGEDSGCVGFGIYEKDINLQIALRVKRRLEENGFRVMMLRESDEFLAVEERVELANSYQADAYVSIHQNTYEGSDKSVSGIETWYDGADVSRDNERLAKLIHKETIESTGAKERVLWDIADLCVTNRTLMPACLIETGFLTNREECRKLSSGEYQEKIAEGIAEGIELYFYSETEL